MEENSSNKEPLLTRHDRTSSSPLPTAGAWIQEMSPMPPRRDSDNDDDDIAIGNLANYSILPYKTAFCDVVKLSMPYSFALFVSIAGDFAISAILSQVGQDRLAAGALVGAVTSILFGTLGSMLASVNMLVAKERVEDQKRADAKRADQKRETNPANVGKFYRQGLYLATLLTVPMIVFTSSAVEPTLLALDQPHDLSHIAQNFFRGVIYGYPAIMFTEVNLQLAFGILKPLLPTAVVISTTLLTGGLGYVLALGKFGLPALQERGLGYAISIAATINCIASTTYLIFNPTLRDYRLFSFQRDDFRDLCKLIKLGLPVAAQTFIEVASLAVPSIFIGWLGHSSLNSLQVVVSYYGLLSSFYYATSRVMVGLIADTKKKNQPLNVARYAQVAMAFGFIISLIGLILFCTAQKPLTSFFINVNDPDNNEIVNLAHSLFIVHGCELFVDSARTITTGALRGLMDPYSPSVVTFATTTLCIGLGYVLGFPADLGVVGVYIGRDLGLLAASVLLWVLWMRRDKPSCIANTTDEESPPLSDHVSQNGFLGNRNYGARPELKDISSPALTYSKSAPFII